MSYSALFFDLDDTLYTSSNGLWEAIRDRMGLYMVERLNIPIDQVQDIRHRYYKTYGTTLRGLQLHHQVDADEYLAYVHDLPLDEYIQPNPDLCAMLDKLTVPYWIFTNADANHARRVLARLGARDCFEGIIDIRALGFCCKPEPDAYLRALALAGSPDPGGCVMLDDAPANLAPARALGFTTVLVNHTCQPDPAAAYTISTALDLPMVLPELWVHNNL
jgi:putative hydrolase of the HAD superfamily